MHAYVVIPRQCYKSYTVAGFYSWIIYWGARNFNAAFFAQNDILVTQNLARVKDLREALPDYLNLKTNADTDNMHSLVYRTGDYSNTITVRNPGNNEETANNVGRGASTMGQWYDEFAFIPYIWVQFGAAIPAYSTVSKAAEKNGSHHHIIITTTAANKKTKSGGWAYQFFNDCAPFTELLYDCAITDDKGNYCGINRDEVQEYIQNNNHGKYFLKIEYQWYELGKPETYLEEQRREMSGMDEFERGILNRWTDSNSDHPLGQERVQELMKTGIDPVRIIMVDKIYVCKFYRDPDLLRTQSHHIVFGMDCSGNNRRDFSTLVGVDVTNSEGVFTMRCNQFSIIRFGRAVAYILSYLFPKSVLIPERNYTGLPVTEIIAENMSQSRIYKDEKDERLGVSMVHNLRKLMYGDVIRVSIFEHGSKIHDKTIIDEIAGLITDKNGRIDHKQNGGHDDLLIAYLYCRWFIMYCKSKSKYMDLIYFNSNLDGSYTTDQLDEISAYGGSDRAMMDYVYGDGGRTKQIERDFRDRDISNNHIINRLKMSIDDNLGRSGFITEQFSYGAEDYLNSYDISPKIKEDDIAIDRIADEYLEDAPAYGKTDEKGVYNFDNDEPEKFEAEVAEKRDTSDDPKSRFKTSFAWA